MESTHSNGSLGAGQLVTCRLDELKPHPSYVRNHLAVPALELASGRQDGRPVSRFPEQLRLHRALDELDWARVDEPNGAVRRKFLLVPEPILITRTGIILSGIEPWRLALSEHRQEISCIEYDVSEDESLQYILAFHRTRRRWNSFILIRLALTLEPYFQAKALDNMRAGGKYKGSTNLSKAYRIDVRQEIANAAGTGTGNVDKVKAILRSAHPNIIVALQNGLLRIHRAWQWCTLPKSRQKENFASYEEERTRRKILRELGGGHSKASFDSTQAIEALRQFETCNPGRIAIRISRGRRTVVTVGQDLLEASEVLKDLNRHD
jgi:hypothetical protein